MKLPPGRLSITTLWPSCSESLTASCRARRSETLPGPSGTMKRSGLAGYGCADTAPKTSNAASRTKCLSMAPPRVKPPAGALCRKGKIAAMPKVQAAGRSLAYEWVGQEANGKPVLVFLHEGLGSIRQWRDFPAKLAAASGCRALVYDRYGYGQSDVLTEKRRTVRFMHDEALNALPEMLAALKIENPILVGHSDGASIALIHAGAAHPARGVVAM